MNIPENILIKYNLHDFPIFIVIIENFIVLDTKFHELLKCALVFGFNFSVHWLMYLNLKYDKCPRCCVVCIFSNKTNDSPSICYKTGAVHSCDNVYAVFFGWCCFQRNPITFKTHISIKFRPPIDSQLMSKQNVCT